MNNYNNAPMGHEDAKDRDDIEQSYIDVTSMIPSGAYTASSLHDAKIVVGRKGSGKTHVLLHIRQLSQKDGRDVVYTQLDHDLFKGRGLHPYQGGRGPEQSVSMWASIWRVALDMAALSRFTARRVSAKAREAIEASLEALDIEPGADPLRSFREAMADRHGELAPELDIPIDPIEALELLLQRYKHLNSLTTFLEDVNFRYVENEIAVLLHRHGVVHFVIDGLDEYAYADPKGWLDLQVGLFTAAFELATVRTYTQYLRLTMSLRNYVFTRASQTPHIDRARSHILRLNWDDHSARKFLNERLLKLHGGAFARSDKLVGKNPLAGWLGFETVQSPRRDAQEDVVRYLLRHSRLSPRNVVEVFNSLCAVQNTLANDGRVMTEFEFRTVVEGQARSVASLMLKVAAEEIIALLPSGAFNRRSSHAPEYLITDIAEKISLTISECGSEVIDRTDCNAKLVRSLARRLDLDDVDHFEDVLKDLEAALWRSSVIAYLQEGEGGARWAFSWSASDLAPAGNAQTARKVGFHSCLIAYCSLEVAADGPVF